MNYVQYGNGPVIFLLHGFCGSSLYWRPVIARLCRHFRVIAPDFPGYGASACQPPCRTLPEFARTVVELADRLGIDKFSVVGHSMGGFVVQQLIADYVQRLNSAVPYGTARRIDSEKRFESAAATLDRLRTDGPSATAARIASTWFTDGASNPYYDLCREAGKGMTLEAGIGTVEACNAADFPSLTKRVETSVLIVHGDQEKSFPIAQALELRDALPGASLCVLPGCGHGAHLQRPDLFNQVLAEFFHDVHRGQN